MADAGFYVWQLHGSASLPLRKWCLVVALSAIVLPLLALRGSLWVNLALYAGALLGLRVVTFGEVRRLWRVISDQHVDCGVRVP